MDEKELRELSKQVKELRKGRVPVTKASVDELKKEIMLHSAGVKAMESQKKRLEALEKARKVRAGADAKVKEEPTKKSKKEDEPPKKSKKDDVTKRVKKVDEEKKKSKKEVAPKEEVVLSKNVRRRVLK